MRRCTLHPRRFGIFAAVVLAAIASRFSATAFAGGGPENVLLVVNSLSPASLTVANHYAKLRAIPPDNLLYFPWPVNAQTTDIDTFRKNILLPVLTAIRNRGMREQIDYIVYSCDFPWGIALDSDTKKFLREAQETENLRNRANGKDAAVRRLEWPKQLGPVGSINGLTYLWQAVIAGFPTYFDFKSNFYMQQPRAGASIPPSIGFRGIQEYGDRGQPVTSGGRRYYLSTMLGVTRPPANTLQCVIADLKRSAAADAIHPKGTIYFVKNNDVRSKVRDELFPMAADELNRLGVRAEIIHGTVPLKKSDVQGVVMGTPVFDWKASGSTILPGAICDNFTSFGGQMGSGSGQTLLSEFLRYGAAGASGAVAEPYAIIDKFPVPMIQVHYARGCTLAEAFYQSVHGPYQLLIVGDPLCQPWADVPQVSAVGVEADAVVRGTLRLTPSAALPEGRKVAAFKLFIDAQPVSECAPGGTLSFDTAKAADGHHELRIVAIGPAPIASQGRQIIPVVFDNHGRTIQAKLATQGPYHIDTPIQIEVQSPGAVGVVAIQGSRVIGQAAGEQGRISIPPKTLGGGPIRLRIAGLGDGGVLTNVMAKPIDFMID